MSEYLMIYPSCSGDSHQKVWVVLKKLPHPETIVVRVFSQEPPLSATHLSDKEVHLGWSITVGLVAVDFFDEEELRENQ